MPFINGKFYANPAYGQALEKARRKEGSQRTSTRQEKSEATPNPRKAAAAPHYEEPQNEGEARLANTIYNETSGLRAKVGAKSGTPGSKEDLHDARVAVGEIARRNFEAGHPSRVAPSELKYNQEKILSRGDPEAVVAHNESLSAAREALSGSDITNGATQYRMRPHAHTKIPISDKPVTGHYGPFDNVQGVAQSLVVAP